MQLVGDFLIVFIDIAVAILISLTTAILWTCAHVLPPHGEAEATNIETSSSKQGRLQSSTKFSSHNEGKSSDAKNLWHIMPPDKIDDQPYPEVVSAEMMVVGIMKSKQIYDPYVFMGNWGGKHNEVKSDGDLTLTSSKSGTCSTTDITLNISKAEYKNATKEEDLELDSGSTNTLVLTSNENITCSGPHTLTPGTLNLQTDADSSFTNGTYNVSLKITTEITLRGTCSGCKLKKTTVSLGTYKLSGGGGTNFTGEPEGNALHSSHNEKCCFFGKQYTWSETDNSYGWHAFLILIPIKISLPLYLYTQFSTHYLTNSENVECNPKILRFGTSQSWDSYYTNRNTTNTVTNTNTNIGTITVTLTKAGKEPTDGTLRKLTKDLYDKAKALQGAVAGGTDEEGKAQELGEAVGQDEETGDKLRQKLKDLAGETGAAQLTAKAQAVSGQYNKVSKAFKEVQTKKAEGKYSGQQREYDKVVEAWNAFNNLHKES